ncbi:conserved hypothetical protein [Burkholderia ambifaria MEX-5]|uniref:Uncharacterized protein n=1 Tax=Burkholderia ambifaria MEX-5 TaxID=396597 RepID=B1TCN3_9BURK|nr:conserved hypothetical protein [Burkholderia ambifaria MEX-5]
MRERGLRAALQRERRAADVRHVRDEHVRRACRDDLLDDPAELLRGQADRLRRRELRGRRVALRLRDLRLVEDVVRAAVDQHDLAGVEAAVLRQVLLDLIGDRRGGRLCVVGVRHARVRMADARLQRHARAALRVAEAAGGLQRDAEAALIRGLQRVAVVLRDVLRPHLARVGREAAAAEAELDLRVGAGVGQAVAERHDLHLHARRRRVRCAAAVVVVTAAACGEQRERGAGDRDLRGAQHALTRAGGCVLLCLHRSISS